MKFVPFIPVLAAALSLLPPLAHAAPPPNDNFANAMVLTGQAVSSTPVDVTDATTEGLEPSGVGTQTVWYTWTAPQDGNATINTQGTPFVNRLSVYNGDGYADLEKVHSNDGEPASLTFPVKAGLVYQVCVGYIGDDSTSGNAVVNIKDAPPTITAPVVVGVPAGGNDNFASAVSLGTNPVVSGFTYNEVATREGQEPDYTGTQTVWWVWGAAADSQVSVNTAGTDFYNKLSVFNGTSLSALNPVALDADSTASVTFPAKAGEIYFISVGYGGDDSVSGNPVLNIIAAAPTLTAPVVIGTQADANDNFANAQDLSGPAVVSSFGFNVAATRETLEPQNGNNTLWWSWTAPAEGVLTISSAGTTFDHYLTPYVGATLSTLQGTGERGSASSPASGSFNVAAGSTYHFSIGSTDNGTGTAVLNLNFSPGLSHVGIAPNAKVIDYSRTHEVSFTLTRTGDITKREVIAYKAKLATSFGTRRITGTQKFKANKARASLVIDVPFLESNQGTLKITLTPGTGYVVDHASAKTLLETE